MSSLLTHIHVQNYRSLADVRLDLKPINVFFGPNGCGKTSLLDVLWFLHDCVDRDTDYALSSRYQGIGLLHDRAKPDARIQIEIGFDECSYEVTFGQAAGRVGSEPTERLKRASDGSTAFERGYMSDRTVCNIGSSILRKCPPNELAISGTVGPFMFWGGGDLDTPVASSLLALSSIVRATVFTTTYFHTRSFLLSELKKKGSETGQGLSLHSTGENLWSVLRNLHDRRSVDPRYDLIMALMKEAFSTFRGLVFEQTSPASVYCSIVESNRAKPVYAAASSDGHIQLLLLLTALYGGDAQVERVYEPVDVLLFDEPDLSLHPWAIAVFAKAVKKAVEEWGRQVFIATHSPVLLSHFEADQMLVAKSNEGRTEFERISDIAEIQDLLEHYAVGSLYMSEEVGPQSAVAVSGGSVG